MEENRKGVTLKSTPQSGIKEKIGEHSVINVYFETYGCSANFSNTEIMEGYLSRGKEENKIEIVNNLNKADVIVINTCIVKSPTESKMWKRLKYFSSLNKRVIVSGCMPEVYSDKIKELYPEFALLGPRSVSRIKEAVESVIQGRSFTGLGKRREVKVSVPKIRKNKVIDIVQISDGCLGNCTYCSVKFAKGHLFSYPAEGIIKDVETGLNDGCKEVWLTSQDNSAYGKDLSNNSKLPFLLNRISELNGKFFVRVGMMNPEHMLPLLNEFVDAFKSEKIFKFIHIPVQSGNNRILKLMNRNYTKDDFKRIVEAFRREIPDITISTDVICGFPTETEEDFSDTVRLIEEVKPDVLNISKFWSRPYTLASEMKQVNGSEIKRRSKLMTETFNSISSNKNKKWINWQGEILIDEFNEKNKSFIGRNYAYKPVIVNAEKSNLKLGDFVRVKITKTSSYDLFADITN